MNDRLRGSGEVRAWWRALLTSTEPECMTYLHSKPLPRPSARPLPRPPAFYSLNIRTTLTTWAAVQRTLSRLDRYKQAEKPIRQNR